MMKKFLLKKLRCKTKEDKDFIISSSLYLFSLLMAVILMVFVKILSSYHHFSQIIFLRCFLSFIWFIPHIRTKGIKSVYHIHRSLWIVYLVRSITGLIAMAMWFYAIKHLSVSTCTAISYIIPIFVSIIAVLFLKEKINLYFVFSIIIGFVGMLLVVQPIWTGNDFAIILVISSSLITSMNIVLLKKISETNNSKNITVIYLTILIICSLPFAIWFWIPIFLITIPYYILLSLVSNVHATTFTSSMRRVGVTKLVPLEFCKLIFAVIISYIVFKQTTDIYTILGVIIIMYGANLGVNKKGLKRQIL